MRRTDYIFASLIGIILVVLATYHIFIRPKNETIEELLIQRGRYERCLDSTAEYIFSKYEEYLPDTYWEGDIYWSIYEGSEDIECWR